jgi:hypothetical protein
MLERDDEDLAVEQLPGAGRADDRELAACRRLATERPQERAAALAEPTPPAKATAARLRELRDRIEQLNAQLQALPTQELGRIENLDERALDHMTQQELLAERRSQLPEPTRRFGLGRDPHLAERNYLTGAIEEHDRALEAVLSERGSIERELGDPGEIRAERDGLEHAIGQTTREHTEVRDELAERELRAPGGWVRDTFGERPDALRAREVWEQGVRQAARYRAQREITDPSDAIGPRPEQREQQREWTRAHRAIERTARQLGRDVGVDRGADLGIGF